jgi:tRNA-dihydrouridine synthase 3
LDGNKNPASAVDDDKKAHAALTALEVNFIGPEAQRQLRSRKVRITCYLNQVYLYEFASTQYPHPIADAYLRALQEQDRGDGKPKPTPSKDFIVVAEPEQMNVDVALNASELPKIHSTDIISKCVGDPPAPQVDTPDVPFRFSEKKRLHWSGKTCELRYACSSRMVDHGNLIKILLRSLPSGIWYVEIILIFQCCNHIWSSPSAVYVSRMELT